MGIQRRPGWRIGSWLVLFAGLAGCAAPATRPADPLAGRIYRTSDLHELTPAGLTATLARADVVYLGEKHDNLEQHARQLEIVRALVEGGSRPAIGFEVFSVDQTALLLSYVHWKPTAGHAAPPPEARLRKALGWEDPQDKQWSYYGPLLMLAREHGLMVFGADLPRSVRRRITRVGTAGLTRLERRLTYPSGFSDATYEGLMRARLKAMHCGYGDDAYLGRLYDNWVARNDTMAMAITETLREQDSAPVVVILGAGHTQNSMGVYERVAHQNPGIVQVNLGLREVARKPEALEHFVRPTEFAGRRFEPDHQYLWFSHRQNYGGPDPCDAFLARKKKPK